MRILIDTNILLDVLMDRESFADAAAAVWELVSTGRIDAVVSAVSVTNLHYVLKKNTSRLQADEGVRLVHELFRIVPVDDKIIGAAIQSGSADFEDAVQAESARAVAATHVVTRDRTGFLQSGLIVFGPRELHRHVSAAPGEG